MSQSQEAAGEASSASIGLIVALTVLATGHMLSNLLRTLPALAVDVMAPDLGLSTQALASEVGAYHFAFAAGQIPLGIALDRFGVRRVSIALLMGVFVGASLAATAKGPVGFILAELALGLATSGMLLCPLALAARLLSAEKFGFWSGLVLSLGNMGLLLSTSPLAWLVEAHGWRAGFWVAACLSIAIAIMVFLVVPRLPANGKSTLSLWHEVSDVIRLGCSRDLRGIIAICFVSLAAVLAFRGLWGGPWLMQVKGLSRIAAGSVLLIFTLSLIVGPVLIGMLDRRLGRRRLLIAGCHIMSALAFLAMAAGGSQGFLARAFSVDRLSTGFDAWMLVVIGLSSSAQPLLFAMTRAAVPREKTGKALSALNLAFFLGTALVQAATGPIASHWGIAAVFDFLAVLLLIGTGLFVFLTRQRLQDAPAE